MENSVRRFYESFDFEKVITDPPLEIVQFLDSEVAFLKESIKPRARILEVGCGYGRLMAFLSPEAQRIVGIDFSSKLLDKARSFLKPYENIDLVCSNANFLPFDDNVFDYSICCNATLGNMPGIEEQVLQEMKRVTKPGGTLLVSVFSGLQNKLSH